MSSSAQSQSGTLLIEIQSPLGEWVQVGYLYNEHDINWFESSADYWRLPMRPILGQIFEEKGEMWKPRAKAAIPHWFSHLLPEGRLRNEAAAAARIHPAREFQLLERLGIDDLPGALRARSVTPEGEIIAPDGDREEENEDQLLPVLKFSLAGVQLKFSVATSERGLTVPVAGRSGDAILKMPDGRAGYAGVPESEFAAMTLAKMAGINVASVSLVDAANVAGLEQWAFRLPGRSLLVDRFDRTVSGRRIHAEELAQVMNIPTGQHGAKYRKANFESIANMVARLVGIDAVGEVIDRIVFNVLIGNGDAHLKNWSFVYPDGRTPKLSPAYDIVPTVLYLPMDDLGLNLDRSKDFNSVSVASFERLGGVTEYGYLEARERAKAAVERILEHWGSLKETLTAEHFKLLDSRLGELSLVQ